MNKLENLLLSCKEPWVVKTYKCLPQSIIDEAIIIDGDKITNKSKFHDEMILKFKLPSYYGKNYDALDECIADLEWLTMDKYVIIVNLKKMPVKKDHYENIEVFLRILNRSAIEWSEPIELGSSWDRPAIPFHTIISLPIDIPTNSFPNIPEV